MGLHRMGAKIVKVGERGQIVILKTMRQIEEIKPKDPLKVADVSRTITIRKLQRKAPEEEVFEFIENSGLTIKDWRDIQNERARER